MQTSYGIIQDIVNQKDPYERLWTTAMSFSNYYDKWMNGPILKVNAEVVDEEVKYHTLSCYSSKYTAL